MNTVSSLLQLELALRIQQSYHFRGVRMVVLVTYYHIINHHKTNS